MTVDSLEQQFPAHTVNQTGRMNHDFQEQSQGVNQDVTLAPIDLFVTIKAVWATIFGGFDTLAIDNGRVSLGRSPEAHAVSLPQLAIYILPNA